MYILLTIFQKSVTFFTLVNGKFFETIHFFPILNYTDLVITLQLKLLQYYYYYQRIIFKSCGIALDRDISLVPW